MAVANFAIAQNISDLEGQLWESKLLRMSFLVRLEEFRKKKLGGLHPPKSSGSWGALPPTPSPGALLPGLGYFWVESPYPTILRVRV